MDFEITPEEAWEIAEAAAAHYSTAGHRVKVEETPWDDAPYVTTLVARRRASTAPHILVEVQSDPDYSASIRDLAFYMNNENTHGELYLAISEATSLKAGMLNQMRREGVGLLLVDDGGSITTHSNARNPALTINPDPVLRFGRHRADVRNIFTKFNDVNRKDALRDMCELAEDLTAQVGTVAISRGVWTITANQFDAKDWNDRINSLGSDNVCRAGQPALCDHRIRHDLHAFRNARNLVDHAPSSLQERYQLERQYADKMLLGSRMVAELVSLLARARRL